MENLQSLTDQVLLEKTSALVQLERETTTQILYHLQEVERRRLFATRGYPSLFAYCVEGLGYSESSAQRRISSMRLLKGLPPEMAHDVEKKIQEGVLSLSVLAQAQSFFQEEARINPNLSTLEKKEVLIALEGKSSRQAARQLQDLSSQSAPPVREYTRPAGRGKTEIHLVVDEATLETLEKIKGLLAHSHPQMGWGELLDFIAKTAWEKLDPSREPAHKTKSVLKNESAETQSAPALPTSAVHREKMSAVLKRAVWKKSEGQCAYADPLTGRVCGSRRFLQIEHLQPVALGGKNELSNCTLRCSVHNQLTAIQVFGHRQMEKYIPSLKVVGGE